MFLYSLFSALNKSCKFTISGFGFSRFWLIEYRNAFVGSFIGSALSSVKPRELSS